MRSNFLVKLTRAWLLTVSAVATVSCAVGLSPEPQAVLSARSAMPKVGVWLHPDIELDDWICSYEKRPVSYTNSQIQPSSWRQAATHSSAIVLNNFIFAQPLPWTVFEEKLSYEEYIALFESFPRESPEGNWYRQLNEHVRTPLAEMTFDSDPISNKLIYIYAHMFGYDPDFAGSIGLSPLGPSTYAWPPKGLDGSWPESFIFEERDGIRRPSFKMPSTRASIANAAYFYVKHFESIGAEVHFSPWREVNGYIDVASCQSSALGCGLDTWSDLYSTYQQILQRISDGQFDVDRIAVYPTFQLESFVGGLNRCASVNMIDQVKSFYAYNAEAGVPFAIGLSTYPSPEPEGLDRYYSKLHHLLDNLGSATPVPCDVDGDGNVSPEEGFFLAKLTTDVRLPGSVPVTIGEAGRPSWLSFQPLDAETVAKNERLGASFALTHLGYHYTSADGSPAYPMKFVAFTIGPNWTFPASADRKQPGWIATASGLSRHWLSPQQPFAGALALNIALDPDGDWDNDGVPDIVFRDPSDAIWQDSFAYGLRYFDELRRASSSPDMEGRQFEFITDNCPYQPNPLQEDVDEDGIGDACDNCLNIANYPQEDWDQDGYGSACDPDLNNDGLIQEAVDLAIIEQCQGTAIDCLAHVAFPELPAGQEQPDVNGKVVLIADMDADEDVDAADLDAWRVLAGDPLLRESGFACAGQTPCPDPAKVMLRSGRSVTVPGPLRPPRSCGP